jgi:hypothetical protein
MNPSFLTHYPTLEEIQSSFSLSNFENGNQLFEEGRVASSDFSPDGTILMGKVNDQEHAQPFSVYVMMDQIELFKVTKGMCSCSDEPNCRHAAAVLISQMKRA